MWSLFSNIAVFICVVACCMLIAGCSVEAGRNVMRPSSKESMSNMETDSRVTLTASAEVIDNKLVVEYSFRNNLSHPVYIFDEMIEYDSQGKPKINRDTAYCFYEEPATLRLVRAILNVPLEKDIYSLEIPYSRVIQSEETVTGRISLDVPIREKSPFYPPPNEEISKLVDCNRVRVLIGWTEPRAGTQITEADIGGQKVLRVRGSWKPFLAEVKIEAKTQVVAYTTVFDRQMPQNTE